jgi:hypothetical protein
MNSTILNCIESSDLVSEEKDGLKEIKNAIKIMYLNHFIVPEK